MRKDYCIWLPQELDNDIENINEQLNTLLPNQYIFLQRQYPSSRSFYVNESQLSLLKMCMDTSLWEIEQV